MAASSFDYDHDVDAEQTPIVDRRDKEYTLHVSNIPTELNEIAIRQLFSDYGRIIDLELHKGWAFITYGSYREAERANRDLHNKRPLHLQITLLRKPPSNKKDNTVFTESSNEIQKQQSQASSYAATESLPACNDAIYCSNERLIRSQPMNALREHNLLPQEAQNMDDRPLSSLNNPEAERLLLNTSKLWTRGVVTVTPDGKRYVTLGRGYTAYEIPEIDPGVERLIERVYEERKAGLYKYSRDKLPQSGPKSCFLCSTKTIQRCEKCYIYYCSKACQVKDWPRHRAECDKIPALVEDTINDMSSLHIKEENQTQITQSSPPNKTVTSQSTAPTVRLRRPNTRNTIQTENSNNTVNINNTDKNNANVGYSLNNNDNNDDDQDRYSSLTNNINGLQPKKESQTNDTSNKNSSQNLTWSEENIDQPKKNNTPLAHSLQNQHNRGHEANTANKRNPNKETFSDNDDNNVRGKNQYHQKNGYQNNESASYNDRGTARQENNAFSVPRNTQYLSKIKFTDVEIIVQLGNNEYWICKRDDIQAREILMTKLESLAVKSRNLKPIIGSVYGVLYEEIWHRALIKSLTPLKVHYIDYGNEEIMKEGTIFKDIRDLLKVPSFAQKIRLISSANKPRKHLRYGDKISVRMLSVDDDDTMVVEMQETSEDSSRVTESVARSSMNTTAKEPASQRNSQTSMNTGKTSAPQESLQASTNTSKKSVSQENLLASGNISKKPCEPPNVLDVFPNLLEKEELSELDKSGLLEIDGQLENNVYSATLCPHFYLKEVTMIYQNMQADCEEIQDYMDYKPQADELICGKEEDKWRRGYVLSDSSSSSVHYIRTLDTAKMIKVTKIVPCPKRYRNVLTFGVTCIVEKPTQHKLEGEPRRFEIVVNKCAQQMLKVNLLIEENDIIVEVIPAVIKLWPYVRTAEVTPAVLMHSELTSGTKVCVTSFESHYVAFVRSLDDEEVKYFNDIMLRVAKCAQTASFLTKPPHINQVVIAPFVDNDSYRATVLKLLEDDNVVIQYIDFGNTYTVKRQKLQVIPHDLAKERSCMTKVVLKDVPRDVAITKEADVYLQDLTDNEVPLTCIRMPLPEDNVYLITATGERINDKIKELLLSRTDDDKKYMLSDIGTAKLGPAGAVVLATVTYPLQNGVRYMMAPSDTNFIKLALELSPKMEKYCQEAKCYVPKKDELCLALYDGGWYRAVCMNPRESQITSRIFFIDYGNTEIVEHQKIRKMHKDFMEVPAMAIECKVINLAPIDSTGHISLAVQRKVAELTDNTNVQVKIVEITKDNVAIIELPEIRDKLIKSGLVS